MKVSFIGEFKDFKAEGLMQIQSSIKNYLQKNKIKITHNSKAADFYHVHTSGFLPALKNKNITDRTIYSLHSNLASNPLEFLRYSIEYLKFYEKSLITYALRMVPATITNFIPLTFKTQAISKMRIIVVPTKYLKNKLNLPNTKLIRLGIDTNKFKSLKTTKNKKITLAYFGHNTPLKGFPDAVKAFKLLNDKDLDLKLHITQYSKKTKSYAKKHNKRIKVQGPSKNIVKDYNKADIIILPFRSDVSSIGIPLTLIETMSCGKPIITTNLPHIKEIAGNTVLYVNTYSPKQIALAINKLKSNLKLQKKLGKSARARVKKFYDEKQMNENYLKLYNSFNSKLSRQK
jgi:glycosyltransferase involved in cell wall biosynthesis